MKKTLRAGLGSALAIALAGLGASAAQAADTITPDAYYAGTVYLVDGVSLNAATQPLAYDAGVNAIPAVGDIVNKFPIPAGATEAWGFIAPLGMESQASKWNAKAFVALTPGGVWLPDMTPQNQITLGLGSPSGTNAVKAAGGDYSLGLAFTTNSGVTVVKEYYGHIHITAGTGAYTFTTTCNGTLGDCGLATPTPTPTPTPTAGSATQGLSAQVTVPAVVDGLLSLTAPASTTSTIGNATIVNGSSTSTGTLGNFQVQDGRAASKPGWTLTTSNVADFVNGTTTIGKQNLGFAPKNVSGVAATLGAAQVAGTAVYPSLFAQMAAGTAGTSTLDADLTFVAPAGSPSGTYTSTLTVTLVSK